MIAWWLATALAKDGAPDEQPPADAPSEPVTDEAEEPATEVAEEPVEPPEPEPPPVLVIPAYNLDTGLSTLETAAAEEASTDEAKLAEDALARLDGIDWTGPASMLRGRWYAKPVITLDHLAVDDASAFGVRAGGAVGRMWFTTGALPIQGGADVVHNASGLYAGAWASTIKWTRDAGGDGDVEQRVAVGAEVEAGVVEGQPIAPMVHRLVGREQLHHDLEVLLEQRPHLRRFEPEHGGVGGQCSRAHAEHHPTGDGQDAARDVAGNREGVHGLAKGDLVSAGLEGLGRVALGLLAEVVGVAGHHPRRDPDAERQRRLGQHHDIRAGLVDDARDLLGARLVAEGVPREHDEVTPVAVDRLRVVETARRVDAAGDEREDEQQRDDAEHEGPHAPPADEAEEHDREHERDADHADPHRHDLGDDRRLLEAERLRPRGDQQARRDDDGEQPAEDREHIGSVGHRSMGGLWSASPDRPE